MVGSNFVITRRQAIQSQGQGSVGIAQDHVGGELVEIVGDSASDGVVAKVGVSGNGDIDTGDIVRHIRIASAFGSLECGESALGSAGTTAGACRISKINREHGVACRCEAGSEVVIGDLGRTQGLIVEGDFVETCVEESVDMVPQTEGTRIGTICGRRHPTERSIERTIDIDVQRPCRGIIGVDDVMPLIVGHAVCGCDGRTHIGTGVVVPEEHVHTARVVSTKIPWARLIAVVTLRKDACVRRRGIPGRGLDHVFDGEALPAGKAEICGVVGEDRRMV